MNADILNLNSRVIFFPVRHHSPACARLVRALAFEIRPDAILIEGPADFNSRLDELSLGHQLPIAIYSYLRLSDDTRRGAFYPFCIYSPEWQALQTAREINTVARFIDLPFAETADARETIAVNRYADGELRRSRYIAQLCRQAGVEDWDALWDRLFEIDENLSVSQFLKRCHHFCFHSRVADELVSETDLRREAFMAERIREAMAECAGKILVVTGGFHSYALFARINDLPFDHSEAEQQDDCAVRAVVKANQQNCDEAGIDEVQQDALSAPAPEVIEHGIALTPYSYQRLDNLTGYESGMPNPGFYHQVWEDRHSHRRNSYRSLLSTAVRDLRQRKQTVSTADLIAVETMAQGLAALRGHSEIWRRDLIDAITGALVKEEIERSFTHPFLEAIYEAFRGRERGRLADGTTLPPLVRELQERLREYDLEPTLREKNIALDLHEKNDLARSRVLHQLRVLKMAGFEKTGGTDFARRDDLSTATEQWRVRWSPEFEAACIEAAIYGASLQEASAAKLRERSEALERDAAAASLLLLDGCLMGQPSLSEEFYQRLTALIREDGSFYSVTTALDHLLYLYRYDELLGAGGRDDLGALLRETFLRAVWLLESSGQAQGRDRELLEGVQLLVQTFERCASSLAFDQESFIGTLRRTGNENGNHPLLRGAMDGALWTLNETRLDEVQEHLRFCASADRLGDFLTGLFALARETAQRNTELIRSIDGLLMSFSVEQFLEALPALRLAFSYFTPREKNVLASTLVKGSGPEPAAPLAALEVDVAVAAQMMAFEEKLFAMVEKYGLRGNA